MSGLSLCGPHGGSVVSWRGWTGGSHFLGWLVTHRPVSGKTPTPTPLHQTRMAHC